MIKRVHLGLISLVLLNLFPASFLFSCTPLWALDSGLSLAKVGLISLTFAPNSFKFLWAPISDILKGRFKFDYLTITLTSSFLILICMIYLSMIDPRKNYEIFIGLLFFMNFLKSFIWDTIDGYRSQLFSDQEQKLATSIFMSTYRGGIMAITGLSILIAKWIDWHVVLQTEVVLMTVLLISTAKLLPRSPAFFKQKPFSVLSAFSGMTKSIPLTLGIIMILTYRFGDIWIFSYLPVFLKESAHMSTTDAGLLVQIMMPCSIVGIWLAKKISNTINNYRLMYMTAVAHFAVLLLLGSTVQFQHYYWLIATVFIEEIISGFFFYTASIWMIRCRNPEYPAYSIATFSSLINIPTIFVGPATTYLVNQQGWFGFFEIPMITTLASIMILQWYLKYARQTAKTIPAYSQ